MTWHLIRIEQCLHRIHYKVKKPSKCVIKKWILVTSVGNMFHSVFKYPHVLSKWTTGGRFCRTSTSSFNWIGFIRLMIRASVRCLVYGVNSKSVSLHFTARKRYLYVTKFISRLSFYQKHTSAYVNPSSKLWTVFLVKCEEAVQCFAACLMLLLFFFLQRNSFRSNFTWII